MSLLVAHPPAADCGNAGYELESPTARRRRVGHPRKLPARGFSTRPQAGVQRWPRITVPGWIPAFPPRRVRRQRTGMTHLGGACGTATKGQHSRKERSGQIHNLLHRREGGNPLVAAQGCGCLRRGHDRECPFLGASLSPRRLGDGRITSPRSAGTGLRILP